jgi:hypothetical protein
MYTPETLTLKSKWPNRLSSTRIMFWLRKTWIPFSFKARKRNFFDRYLLNINLLAWSDPRPTGQTPYKLNLSLGFTIYTEITETNVRSNTPIIDYTNYVFDILYNMAQPAGWRWRRETCGFSYGLLVCELPRAAPHPETFGNAKPDQREKRVRFALYYFSKRKKS